MSKIYGTSLRVAEMSGVPVWEKAPLVGSDALAHRSGIHQDGATKTKHLKKGAYRAFEPSLIGRNEDEKLGFTSQSGKTAIYEILNKTPYKITMQEAVRLAPIAKSIAEEVGELSPEKLLEIYIDEIFTVKGAFKLVDFKQIDKHKYNLEFTHNDMDFDLIGHGDGTLDACLDALSKAGFALNLVHYEQIALNEEKGVKADAMSIIHFGDNKEKAIVARAMDNSTARANVKAIFNGLNLLNK